MKILSYLVGDPFVGRKLATPKTLRIKCISEDKMFAATSGGRKPARHLQIRMEIKSLLAGSRKVITK